MVDEEPFGAGAEPMKPDALSRPARSGPLPIRLGFSLFGRTQQLRFYWQIYRRLRRLTELETRRSDSPAVSSQA